MVDVQAVMQNGNGVHSNGIHTDGLTDHNMPAIMRNFQKGVGLSIWQASFDDDLSNWSRFVKPSNPLTAMFSQFKSTNIGKSCNFWDRYREDLQLAKDAGCNAIRFSFEWARIEPKQGQYDQEAIKRYSDMLDLMDELGLEPCATLHHFVHPIWFEDMGGFMKEDNVMTHFVGFCRFMFGLFHKRIRMWSTFNEPTSYAFMGWMGKIAPPGHFFSPAGIGYALLNVLKAHKTVYQALKAMPGGQEAQIGFNHHIIYFTSNDRGPLKSLARYLTGWLDYWWGRDVVHRWMKTGEFEWKVPFLGTWITYKDPDGKPPCDWWGINYYSRVVANGWLQPSVMPGEVMTDMHYPSVPAGLYEAIKMSSEYGVPMYITETGCADAKDDRRKDFIHQYFGEVLRAVADGYDVRGLYYWTLVDSYEWADGFAAKFGLYDWNQDGTNDRVLKEGSKELVRFYKTLPDNLQDFRKAARAAQPKDDGHGGVDFKV